MIVVGIDPGLDGALAWVEDGRLIGVDDMPVLETKTGKSNKRAVSASLLANAITDGIDACGLDMAVVERVSAMPGQGVSSMFNFGRSAGIVEGVLAGLRVPITFVTPQAWQKVSGKRPGKDGSRARCIELWPEHSALWARVKDDGRADAALIARFGWTP